MAKTQKTTRDTEFNYNKSEQTKTISSVISYNATKDFKNIQLIGVEEGISVSGTAIINHAKANKTLGNDAIVDVNAYVEDEGRQIKSDPNSAYKIYGSPFQVTLNNSQHYNNCGIESTLNNLAMAGLVKMKDNLSDQKSVEKNFLKDVWTLGLANDGGKIGVLDKADGGTEPDDYKDILAHFDIGSTAYYISRKCGENTEFSNLKELAYKISQGYGAIVGVCSDKLWQSAKYENTIDHAIAITGVVYNQDTEPSSDSEPLGFYIHDTGGWMSRYISLDEFKEVTLYDYHGMLAADKEKYTDGNYNEEDAEDTEHYSAKLRNFDSELREYIGKKSEGIFVTITDEPIKSDMFNLNATGDSQDNTIWGNSGDNIIKGMNGNDILYGKGGDDEIRGGKGNDIIIGDTLTALDKGIFTSYLEKSGVKNPSNLFNGIDITESYPYGENMLYGDAGNDIIVGGEATDLIYGGAGDDYIYTGDGRNAVYAGKGKDIIIGGWDNDRLFGDAGNDIIYGLGDDDTIHGGAGSDTIYGGRGNDTIETGSGNDEIYFEGTEHGIDTVTSQGGTTTFRFIDEKYIGEEEPYSKGAKISDMYFNLSRNEENTKLFDFGIAYTKDENNMNDGVDFQSFFNSKTGKSKTLTVFDVNNEQYKVSASKSAKAVVANTRTTGDNASIHNILFTTNLKGSVITTSDKNDIVTMVESEDVWESSYKSDSVFDTIKYTKGNDLYVSEERNTRYFVENFGDATNLQIFDNVKALEKRIYNEQTQEYETKEVTSGDDRLYIQSEKENIKFLFDVAINDDDDAITTKYNGLFVVKKGDTLTNKFISLADNIMNESVPTVNGTIYMDSFFGYDKDNETTYTGNGFFGNGRIEAIRYGTDDNYYEYTDYSADFSQYLAGVASEVAEWLSETDYTSAFEALTDENITVGQLQALVKCYTGETPQFM